MFLFLLLQESDGKLTEFFYQQHFDETEVQGRGTIMEGATPTSLKILDFFLFEVVEAI